MMPALHGAPTAHWSDQPAGCWLPHLKPGSTAPIRPSDIRPVPLTPGPASQELINAVKATLADADAIFSSQPLHETAKLEFNELGEIKQPDDATQRIPGVETYYGWSRAFCNEMRQQFRGPSDAPRHRRYRSTTRSSSPRSSRSRSPPSPRRRRFASRSRSPGRGWSRSLGRRASPSSSGFCSRSLRSSSYSRSRSPAPRRGLSHRRRSYTRSPSRSHSRSAPPPRCSSPLPSPYHDRDSRAPPQPPDAPPMPAVPPGPASFPLPLPPPPIGYQGTFPPPPPPPPLPPQGWNPNMPGFVLPQMMGSGWGAGPVPLPPPSPFFNGHPQHHNPWGRGNGRGGGGRGYRGHGRGGNGRGGYGYGPR